MDGMWIVLMNIFADISGQLANISSAILIAGSALKIFLLRSVKNHQNEGSVLFWSAETNKNV